MGGLEQRDVPNVPNVPEVPKVAGAPETPPGEVASGDGPPVRELEIHIGRGRKWQHWVAFAVVFIALGALLVWMFMNFGATIGLAGLLVGFMLSYMLIMGQWASGKWVGEQRNRRW